ncbi:transposase family protein [Aliicoccus persicus]|uniref:transposase family protein n=1 Tax=Aliicoccus persicus TaxID=930138 RepID=UPI001178B601|nr:transposase family protein [Aliicoccus persicus]
MNRLSRNLIKQAPMEVLVSDLTDVKVSGKWHYICVFIDLFNREIVGHIGHSDAKHSECFIFYPQFLNFSVDSNVT